MKEEWFLIGLIVWVVSFFLLFVVIRKAMDSSRTSRRVVLLVKEIRMLRKELRDQKHIIDMRL